RWEAQRRALAPAFSPRSVTSFVSSMRTVADQFADKWRTVSPGCVIDVAAETTLMTLNVLALTIFSDGIGEDFEEFRLAMNAYFGAIGRIGAFDLFNMPRFVRRPGHRRLRRTMTYFEGVIDNMIDVRRRKLASQHANNAPNDLLTLLLRSLDPSTGRQLSL